MCRTRFACDEKDGEGEREKRHDVGTYFQWVYWEWGPVENLTFLWVHSNEMSNHARNAWMSEGCYDVVLGSRVVRTYSRCGWRSTRRMTRMSSLLSWL